MRRGEQFLEWPFFTPRSTASWLSRLDAWAARALCESGQARRTATRWIMPAGSWCASSGGRAGRATRCPAMGQIAGGERPASAFDVRSLALIRETLARHDALADFAFAMQGLGSGAISLAGSPELKARYLPRVAAGEAIAAFALSEPDAGSDVAAIQLPRAPGRRFLRPGRREDLDLQRRHRGFLLRVRAHQRAGTARRRHHRRSRHQRLRRRCRHAGLLDLAAHRCHLAAPARHACAFESCRIPAGSTAGGRGRRIQARDADARYVSAPPWPARRSDSRSARSMRRWTTAVSAPHVRQDARGFPTDPGGARRHGDRHRCGAAAHLPRRVAARPRRARTRRKWPWPR